jgi:hypothetical protein
MKMPAFVEYNPAINRIGVSITDALDMLHEPDRSEDSFVVCEAREIFEQMLKICDIRGGYTIYDQVELFSGEGKIRIGGLEIETHRKVCGYMKGAEAMAVFVCTAGEGFTELSKRYNSEGDYMKGFITDTFGSLVVEKAMDYIQTQLQEQVQQSGLQATNRYSPGYCNWHLSGQKQLFGLLPDKPCGISLTESALMLPIKSVSGIVGIGHNVKKSAYACETCGDVSCIYRSIKKQRF